MSIPRLDTNSINSIMESILRRPNRSVPPLDMSQYLTVNPSGIEDVRQSRAVERKPIEQVMGRESQYRQFQNVMENAPVTGNTLVPPVTGDLNVPRTEDGTQGNKTIPPLGDIIEGRTNSGLGIADTNNLAAMDEADLAALPAGSAPPSISQMAIAKGRRMQTIGDMHTLKNKTGAELDGRKDKWYVNALKNAVINGAMAGKAGGSFSDQLAAMTAGAVGGIASPHADERFFRDQKVAQMGGEVEMLNKEIGGLQEEQMKDVQMKNYESMDIDRKAKAANQAQAIADRKTIADNRNTTSIQNADLTVYNKDPYFKAADHPEYVEMIKSKYGIDLADKTGKQRVELDFDAESGELTQTTWNEGSTDAPVTKTRMKDALGNIIKVIQPAKVTADAARDNTVTRTQSAELMNAANNVVKERINALNLSASEKELHLKGYAAAVADAKKLAANAYMSPEDTAVVIQKAKDDYVTGVEVSKGIKR